MWCASRLKGWNKTLCPQRNRGSVNVRLFHLCSPCSPLIFCPRPLHCPCLPQKPLSAHIPFHEISLPTQMLYPFLKTNTLRLSFKARYMTMRVRGTLKGTLRKKILSYATQSKKVKKTGKQNCFFCSCACKKLNQSRKAYQNMRQSQRRRQNQKRRYAQPPWKDWPWRSTSWAASNRIEKARQFRIVSPEVCSLRNGQVGKDWLSH